MNKSKSRDIFLPVALLVMVCAGLLFFFIVEKEVAGFPSIAPGMYQGRVSVLNKGGQSSATLYVERIADSDNLLVVVFDKDWEPQVVQTKSGESDVDGVPLTLPLELNGPGGEISLTGSGRGRSYSGEVMFSDQSRGSWKLKAADISDIRREVEGIDSLMVDGGWLDIKARLRELESESAAIVESLGEINQSYGRLKKFVDDRELLTRRSLRRRKDMEEKVSTSEKENVDAVKSVNDLVSELDLLARISKRGRVVSLARNVAKRERKWYLANWSAREDSSGVEELLARRMKVSVRDLNAGERKAKEVQALQQEIEKENALIRELQAEMKRRIDKAKEKKDGGSFLERIFG